MNNDVVNVSWLKEHLFDKNLILLDSSPISKVGGEQSPHKNVVIPKARLFDLKHNFSDNKSSFPNTVPSERQFENECRKLGINNTSKIVVYDNLGIYTSPRVWWLFKIMGHQNVSVLDGGLLEWIKKGFETEKTYGKTNKYNLGDFNAKINSKYIITYNQVLENTRKADFTIIDARSSGRFNGIENEPRKQLNSGCIPNSVNIPYKLLLEENKFKPVEELNTIFQGKISETQNVVFSCGSGITACIVILAYNISCQNNLFLYDGSWTEWAELQGLKHSV